MASRVQFLVIRALHARLDSVERIHQQVDRESRESARYPDVGAARIVGVGGHLRSAVLTWAKMFRVLERLCNVEIWESNKRIIYQGG